MILACLATGLAIAVAVWLSAAPGVPEHSPPAGTPHLGSTPQPAAVQMSDVKPMRAGVTEMQERASARNPADPVVWGSIRRSFAITPGLAARIQDALADPSAAKLFHTMDASSRCGVFETLAGSRAAEEASAAGVPVEMLTSLKALAAICGEVSAMHGGFRETYYKVKAARERLDPQSRMLLDAIDGKGVFSGSPLRARFAAVSVTRDPVALAVIGGAWSLTPNARLSGKIMDSDDLDHFSNAWAIAACEADDACTASVGSFRLCIGHGSCEGSVRERMQRGLAPNDLPAWRNALNAVTEALRTNDFSRFD